MRKNIVLNCFAFLVAVVATVGSFRSFAQGTAQFDDVRGTKNLIVLIPDGTSIGVVSAARWYKFYNNMGKSLAIDQFMCGTVRTFSSNAPIGDSAPTTSCYMTGMQSKTGFVSTYPTVDKGNDLVRVDSSRAYQPLATLFEAAKIYQHKQVGLVVTCEFPHATPADCMAHYYDRGNYKYLSWQMANQNIDVMFGGGVKILNDSIRGRLKQSGIKLIEDDIKGFRALEKGERVWALFGDRDLPYDLDRDTMNYPSLAEMTERAITQLSQSKDGFVLMVEGSKIDWAAHANDAVGCITEFIAFDDAVQRAIDFAKRDGNTTVVIMPDHGNSGFTIGRRDLKSYDKASISDLFENVSKYRRTASGMEQLIKAERDTTAYRTIFREYAGIELTVAEVESIVDVKRHEKMGADYTEASKYVNLLTTIKDIMNSRTYFGFTSGGHTGEDVFLAAYHPAGDIPRGVVLNSDLNQYLRKVVDLPKPLEALTDDIFAKHTEVFAGMSCNISLGGNMPVLVVKNGKNTLKVEAFGSIATLNGKEIDMGSVAIYIDRNSTFYIPRKFGEMMRR